MQPGLAPWCLASGMFGSAVGHGSLPCRSWVPLGGETPHSEMAGQRSGPSAALGTLLAVTRCLSSVIFNPFHTSLFKIALAQGPQRGWRAEACELQGWGGTGHRLQQCRYAHHGKSCGWFSHISVTAVQLIKLTEFVIISLYSPVRELCLSIWKSHAQAVTEGICCED